MPDPTRQRPQDGYDPGTFLPYLLTRAAEAASLEFAREYRARHGLLRAEWRVLFHLGRSGPVTASGIVAMTGLHKTMVSRAAARLEERGLVVRSADETDRRRAHLGLTRTGRALYDDLVGRAAAFDRMLAARFSRGEWAVLIDCLDRLARPDEPPE